MPTYMLIWADTRCAVGSASEPRDPADILDGYVEEEVPDGLDWTRLPDAQGVVLLNKWAVGGTSQADITQATRKESNDCPFFDDSGLYKTPKWLARQAVERHGAERINVDRLGWPPARHADDNSRQASRNDDSVRSLHEIIDKLLLHLDDPATNPLQPVLADWQRMQTGATRPGDRGFVTRFERSDEFQTKVDEFVRATRNASDLMKDEIDALPDDAAADRYRRNIRKELGDGVDRKIDWPYGVDSVVGGAGVAGKKRIRRK